MLSEKAIDYLETIYNIAVEGETIVGARLADKFGVSRATVSENLQRLARKGYLALDPSKGPTLTEQGTATAEKSLRNHRLAERFLFDALGLDWVTAHEEAHALQHALTPVIEARIVALLGNPTTCPHGNPIPGSGPDSRTYLQTHRAARLSDAPPDEALTVLSISEVVEDETALLSYLCEKGIMPGAQLVVRDLGPARSGPLTLEVEGASVALNPVDAQKVWIWNPSSVPGTW